MCARRQAVLQAARGGRRHPVLHRHRRRGSPTPRCDERRHEFPRRCSPRSCARTWSPLRRRRCRPP
ncbi:hypothetical protein [Ornithinimicrobium kibberense]|uniref:hypothetical protein n=1 Tax=Ornithinimicrobium kibberense TaxID=282060 RepID=UPI00361541A2